jgi:hypothetical protein
VRIRRGGSQDAVLDAALAAAGCELVSDDGGTLVHLVSPIDDLDGFTPTVTAWASAARRAVEADADVVTIVGAEGFDTDDPAAAMLAHGMAGATRALAFERDREGGRVNLVIVGDDANPDQVAATVRWLLEAPVTAQLIDVGVARHGRLPA